ncbi:MAG TPA: hypothetical protein VFC77_07255 [Myxococcota bacterium]|nr:hypothetical protein [Myxococcota bacterium]
MPRSVAKAGALLVAFVAAAACADIRPPRAKVLAPLDPRLDRVVYVTTTRARETIVASLKQAGFRVAADARETSVVVAVKLGGVRARDPKCGTLQNVSYDVFQGGVRTAVIKGRGWTGANCEPNVYDQMNLVLAHLFGPGSGPLEAAGAPEAPAP